MEPTVENLCGYLTRSHLLNDDEVESLHQRWRSEGAQPSTSASQFTRWLVREKYLTEYQAGLLIKGQINDFFLDEFKILERVGRGRMAGVYKAVTKTGAIVAIKVLPPSRAKVLPLLARFQREAQLSLRLQHVNIVQGLNVGETKGLHYLVMEFLEGETLDEVLQRRKTLPPLEAARLIHQTLLGLQHMHESGMVHRDIKPANLMLVPGGRNAEPDTTTQSTVKILDIGLARPLLEEALKGDSSELTQEGVLLGTPDYLSPEQARDPRTIDIRSDLYSLGCVFHQLLVGQPPFPDLNLLNQMVRHATEPPRPVRSFDPTIPEAIEQIIIYMLAKNADHRFPTPARAAETIAPLLGMVAESKATKSTAGKAGAKRGSAPIPVSRPHAPPDENPFDASPVDVELIAISSAPIVAAAKPVEPARHGWILAAIVAGALGLTGAIVVVMRMILR